MAHIYVFSPSGAVRDKVAFRRGLQRLKALGHEVEVDVAALQSHTRFAGDDATRLAAIHRAAAAGADVALISRGGYGLTRLLPELRYRILAKAIEKGTRFVGLSDFTAFQNALLARTGAITWAGPALGEDFGAEAPDDIMEACFEDLLSGQGEGAGWQFSRQTQQAYADRKPGVWARDAVLWGGTSRCSPACWVRPICRPSKRACFSWRTLPSIPTALSACSRNGCMQGYWRSKRPSCWASSHTTS